MLGKIEGRRNWQQRMRWLDNIADSMDMNLGNLLERVKNREAWRAVVHGAQRVRHDLAAEQQQQVYSKLLVPGLAYWRHTVNAVFIVVLT